MCYFLTIAIPARHAKLARDAFGRGLGVSETENARLKSAFPASYKMYLITEGMCSCGLYSDPEKNEPIRDEAAQANRLRAAYERRGWSEAKIERAVEQSLGHRTKMNIPSGLQPELKEKLSALFHDAEEGGLFVHFYDDDIESARLPTLHSLKCTLDEFSSDAMHLPVDTAVLVRKGRRK
jgi:hypothetical protein